MTLSELVLLIHWEVQKSFNLIDDLRVSEKESNDNLNIQLGMEKFEITLPLTMSESEKDYEEVNKSVADPRFRKFYYPLIIQSDLELKGKKKGIAPQRKGKVLDVSVGVKPNPKTDIVERGGQVTITLKRMSN